MTNRWADNEPQPMQPDDWYRTVFDYDGIDESIAESEVFWEHFRRSIRWEGV